MSTIELAQAYGGFLGRSEGEQAAKAAIELLNAGLEIEVDFARVEAAIPSFFNAMLGGVAEQLGVAALDRIRPRNESDLYKRSWRAALRNASTSDEESEAMWTAAREALRG